MPNPFLNRVADYLLKNHEYNLSKILVVLPSQRAGLFLRRTLSQKISHPTLGPKIKMVDQMASEISGLQMSDALTLNFELYNSYKQVFGTGADSFEEFMRWSSRLLQDFNEIDRYLIDANQLFVNLIDIKKLESWGVDAETPEMIDQFVAFWKKLSPLYHQYRETLIEKGLAYQGMMFRRAAERIKSDSSWEKVLSDQGAEHVVFVGFNALNRAEITLIRSALDSGLGDMLFDIDTYYFEDPNHEAGMFIREYLKWPYFQKKEVLFKTDSLRGEAREIHIIGVPRQLGMAKAASEKLNFFKSELGEGELTDRLALVLADEGMLLPTLNSLPDEFDEVNVTMGLPLKSLNLTNSIEVLFEAHERAIRLKIDENRAFQFYHKDIERLILTPFGRFILNEGEEGTSISLSSQIRKYNAPFVSPKRLAEWTPNAPLFCTLLSELKPNELLHAMLNALAVYHDRDETLPEEKEAAKRLHGATRKLIELFFEYERETDLKTALLLFRQLQREEKLDFFGEPLRGLQVMGVLETRLLSFEGLVMTHVNEEQLPAGKTDNSFIPYDVKRSLGLPTHREKDAIYAYHFYRLLQGASKVYLLYNTESQAIGSGEASRFIEQIRKEFKSFKRTEIIEEVYTTPVQRYQLAESFELEKGDFLRDALTARATKGIAPSHLVQWVRDPGLFYKRYIIGMHEADEVEEVMGDRTMGNVVHEVLEKFYKPFMGSCPQSSDFDQYLAGLDQHIAQSYREQVGRNIEATGRNALVLHAMREMISAFMKSEKKRALEFQEKGVEWEIVGVEVDLRSEIEVPGIAYPILVKGQADRVDRVNDTLVVIDYKTGITDDKDVSVSSLEELATDSKKGKGLQLFTYAWLLSKSFPSFKSYRAGIYALRDTAKELIVANIKSKSDSDISADDIQTFEGILSSILYTIFSEEGVFASEPKTEEE